MIIDLGQTRPSRRERNGTTVEWPSDEIIAQYVYTAEMIADLVAKHHSSLYQYGRIESVRKADSDIRPDQRFYAVEYRQAAEILADRFPEGVGKNEWYTFLRNYMGYRIVDMPFCSYGMEPDTVTRQCVQERGEIPQRRDIPVEPTPDQKDERSKTGDLILPLGIVAVLALAMLSGGRR